MRRKRQGKVRSWREPSISLEVVKEFEFFSPWLTFARLSLLLLVGAGAAASSGGGPTGTPLPDKKLLLFILDRLQK